MPPKPLFNPAILNFEHTVFDKDAIRSRLPHRYEMEMLDRVIYFDVRVKPLRESKRSATTSSGRAAISQVGLSFLGF